MSAGNEDNIHDRIGSRTVCNITLHRKIFRFRSPWRLRAKYFQCRLFSCVLKGMKALVFMNDQCYFFFLFVSNTQRKKMRFNKGIWYILKVDFLNSFSNRKNAFSFSSQQSYILQEYDRTFSFYFYSVFIRYTTTLKLLLVKIKFLHSTTDTYMGSWPFSFLSLNFIKEKFCPSWPGRTDFLWICSMMTDNIYLEVCDHMLRELYKNRRGDFSFLLNILKGLIMNR